MYQLQCTAKCSIWQYICALGFKTHFKLVVILGIMITCETSGRVIVTAGPWPHGRESTVGIPSSAAAVASPVVPDSESRRVTAGRLPGRARAAESGSAWQGLRQAAGPRPGLALTAPGLRDFVRQTPTQTLTLTWASLAAGAWSQTVLKAPPGRAGPAAGAAAPPALPPPSPRQ